MVEDCYQKQLIEFKCAVELLRQLPDTVYELNKDRSTLIVPVITVTVTDTLIELVTK